MNKGNFTECAFYQFKISGPHFCSLLSSDSLADCTGLFEYLIGDSGMKSGSPPLSIAAHLNFTIAHPGVLFFNKWIMCNESAPIVVCFVFVWLWNVSCFLIPLVVLFVRLPAAPLPSPSSQITFLP